MRQLIAFTLVLALTLAVMVAPTAAQTATAGITQSNTVDPATYMPNFLSYRDRSRITSPESDDPAELDADNDPTGLSSHSETPTHRGQRQSIRAQQWANTPR